MKVIIVSSSPEGRVAQRFLSAASDIGLDAEVINSDTAHILLSRDLTDTVILPRIAPEQNQQTQILESFALMGARIINRAAAWRLSRDKWQSTVCFERNNVPTPRTILALPGAIFSSTMGMSNRAVYKPLDGTHGEGVEIVHEGDRLPEQPGILQEYIETSGQDVRLIVVGGRVVASMGRQAKSGDFRANLHQGASAISYIPSDEMRSIAVKAAHSLGLVMAGVDVLPVGSRCLVVEANPSPGLGIEAHSKVDVAREVMDAIRQGRLP